MPVDSSAQCKYIRENSAAHRYFQRFFEQIKLTGSTCRFVQSAIVFIAVLAIAFTTIYNYAIRDVSSP